MFHKINQSILKNNNGFALIAVIFLMVIMAGAVLMMGRLSDMQQAERNLEVLGARANSAAKSALQWAVYRLSDNDAYFCNTATTSVTAPTWTLDEGSLKGFDVTLTCNKTEFAQGLTTITTYALTAAASYNTYDGDAEYVYRKVSAVIELES